MAPPSHREAVEAAGRESVLTMGAHDPGMNSLAQWQVLEQFLRQRYADMEITGLEYSAGSARVQLDKVGDNLPAVLGSFS